MTQVMPAARQVRADVLFVLLGGGPPGACAPPVRASVLGGGCRGSPVTREAPAGAGASSGEPLGPAVR